jgi:hypothetical protein
MRTRVLAIVAALFAVALTSTTAAEAGWRRSSHYYDGAPRFYRVYDGYPYDPYRYRYEPRGWYPYYNSGYWRPARELRYRRACCRPAYYALPPYYQSWGYPRAVYVQKGWRDRRYARRYHRNW